MTSRSLHLWRTERSDALDRLERVHSRVTGGLAGRPREVAELNRALFLRLAAEVQGFCRDQHDEAVEVLCLPDLVTNPAIQDVLRASLTRGRKLDSGNAGPGNIGSDWAMLGIALWSDLRRENAGVRGAPDWNHRLEWLNSARNGIAHNDSLKVAAAHAVHPLTIRTFRGMRKSLDRFSSAVEEATGAYLRSLDGNEPW